MLHSSMHCPLLGNNPNPNQFRKILCYSSFCTQQHTISRGGPGGQIRASGEAANRIVPTCWISIRVSKKSHVI